MSQVPPTQSSSGESDRLKLQFEYAWRWFEYHAKQRTQMLNFFLIITGIFGNAFILSYKDAYSAIAAVIAALGILMSLGFVMFDLRNRSMAAQGEDVLERLETAVLGNEYVDAQGRTLAPLAVERRTGMRQGCRHGWKILLKHKFWVRALELAVGGCFVAALLLSLVGQGLRGANVGGASELSISGHARGYVLVAVPSTELGAPDLRVLAGEVKDLRAAIADLVMHAEGAAMPPNNSIEEHAAPAHGLRDTASKAQPAPRQNE